MDRKQSKYSEFKIGKINIEIEKAFLALKDGFTEKFDKIFVK